MRRIACAALLLLSACGSGPRFVVPTPRATDYSDLRPEALYAVSQEEVFVVGSVVLAADQAPEGLVLGSRNGGRNWRRLLYSGHDLHGVTFTALHFHDRLRGWIGGLRVLADAQTIPIVLRTDDGGNRWTETELLVDPSVVVTSVQTIRFESSRRGTVQVEQVDPVTRAGTTSVYQTTDAGRTWTVIDYRGRLVPPEDPRVSWIQGGGEAPVSGYRLVPAGRPGATLVEATNSGGKDWTRISTLEAPAMDSWWGGADDRR